ncbi:MAG: polysaccharide biosynthesis/export family protein [Erythrobacter sp.]
MKFRFVGKARNGIGVSMMVLALGACATTPPAIVGAAVTEPNAELGQSTYTFQQPTVYRLRAADVISITVFREPDFSLDEVRVGVDGIVSLPLLGGYQVGGKTTGEVEADLTDRFAAVGLRNPRVSVNISDYASHLVTVDGAVNKAGVYAFQPGARLSSAIAMAEGVNRVAELDEVAMFRNRPDGIYVAKFDLGAVNRGTMLDPILEPGDRVVVGTSSLSQFWQDALRALPALGVFASISNN